MNTPILNALKTLQRSKPFSFHTPGHKNGQAMPQAFFDDFSLYYDTTEITGLDNLLMPEGIIKESLALIASAHRATFARYLLGGTTSGLLASILALAKDKEIFIPRHAHQSIYNGLILANAKPIYLMPTLDNDHHIPLGISLDTLKEAIEAHPTCKLMVLVHPTYHGITWQNEVLIQYAKMNGITVIVDEAHGAHFSFSDKTPKSALDLGADIVIKSYHKTLPSLTQGSVLVSNRSDLKAQLDKTLKLLSTTSPSYPIMASMESACAFMAEHGQSYLEDGAKKINALIRKLSLKTIQVIEKSDWQKDPFRLWLKSTKLNGKAFQEAYERENAFIEMHDDGILLLLPLNPKHDTLSFLESTLKKIDEASLSFPNRKESRPFYSSVLPKEAISIAKAHQTPTKLVPIKEASGLISGAFLQAYPPGIPQVVPGEIIDNDLIASWIVSGHDETSIIEVIS